MADLNVRADSAASNPGNPTPVHPDDLPEFPVSAEQFFEMLAEYDEAYAAFEADETEEEDGPIEMRYCAAHNAMRRARPSDPRAILAHGRWWLEDERRGTRQGPSPIVVRAVDAFEVALRRRPLHLEIDDLGLNEAARRIGCASDMLDDVLCSGVFNAHADFDEISQGLSRVHYFVDRIRDHQRELVAALAEARPVGDLWKEFEAACHAVDHHEGADALADDDPRLLRFDALQEQLVEARPADLPGLHAQLRYYRWVTRESVPNAEQEAMLEHVTDQLAALAEGAQS